MHHRVAIDVGPLIGPVTGVGRMVTGILDAFDDRADTTVTRYVLSRRVTLPAGVTRLALPARIAIECWARSNYPHADRTFGGIDLIHGTNYVVPPTKLPTVITVHDSTIFNTPELVSPVARRFAPVVRRADRARCVDSHGVGVCRWSTA